jgi:hypothetical protein
MAAMQGRIILPDDAGSLRIRPGSPHGDPAGGTAAKFIG